MPNTDVMLLRKFPELVCVALNVACTNLNPESTRGHIRAALAAGATSDEITNIEALSDPGFGPRTAPDAALAAAVHFTCNRGSNGEPRRSW